MTTYKYEEFPWIPDDKDTWFINCKFYDDSKKTVYVKWDDVTFRNCEFILKKLHCQVTHKTDIKHCLINCVESSCEFSSSTFQNVTRIIQLCRSFDHVDIRRLDIPFDHANVLFKYLTKKCMMKGLTFYDAVSREAPSMSLRKEGMVSFKMKEILIPHFITYVAPTLKQEELWDSFEKKICPLVGDKAILQLYYKRRQV